MVEYTKFESIVNHMDECFRRRQEVTAETGTRSRLSRVTPTLAATTDWRLCRCGDWRRGGAHHGVRQRRNNLGAAVTPPRKDMTRGLREVVRCLREFKAW